VNSHSLAAAGASQTRRCSRRRSPAASRPRLDIAPMMSTTLYQCCSVTDGASCFSTSKLPIPRPSRSVVAAPQARASGQQRAARRRQARPGNGPCPPRALLRWRRRLIAPSAPGGIGPESEDVTETLRPAGLVTWGHRSGGCQNHAAALLSWVVAVAAASLGWPTAPVAQPSSQSPSIQARIAMARGIVKSVAAVPIEASQQRFGVAGQGMPAPQLRHTQTSDNGALRCINDSEHHRNKCNVMGDIYGRLTAVSDP